MNKERIAQNLAAVENHFHSEELSEVETVLRREAALKRMLSTRISPTSLCL